MNIKQKAAERVLRFVEENGPISIYEVKDAFGYSKRFMDDVCQTLIRNKKVKYNRADKSLTSTDQAGTRSTFDLFDQRAEPALMIPDVPPAYRLKRMPGSFGG